MQHENNDQKKTYTAQALLLECLIFLTTMTQNHLM